jgi:predicted nucleotidyltransferase
LFAFGSVLTEKFHDKSDIDLLVSFKPLEPGEYADNYFQAAENFEKIFNRPVDLITDKSLSNPYFINAVNVSKKLIYG